MYLFYSVCVLGAILAQHGSFGDTRVNLTASPNPIRPGNTPTLKVRCSVGAHSVAKVDVIHVTSISVLRTNTNTGVNETVATVTAFGPPTAHQDLGKLKVTGNTTGTNPYLELTWINPSAHQAGSYVCEVFGLNSEQLPETLTESLQVGLNEPTTEELLLYIADLDRRAHGLENRLQTVQGANVQTGAVVCIQGSHDYPITFSAPYDKVPTVITAVGGTQSSDGYVYKPTVASLNPGGFTLRCTSFEATSVVWVAL